MAKKKSLFLRFVAIALIIAITPIFALAATVAATGVATVRVAESGPDGTNLYLPVPALLLDLAVIAAPLVIPDGELARARAEIAPYREGLEAMADALRDCPDGVLVEVRDRRDHVRVAKRGRSFEITVESDDADVRVTVPARLLGRALDVLG